MLPHCDANDAPQGGGIAVAEYGQCSQGVFWCRNTNCVVDMQHGLVMWLQSKYLFHGSLPGVRFGDEDSMRIGMAFFARTPTLAAVKTETKRAAKKGEIPQCTMSSKGTHGEEESTAKAKDREPETIKQSSSKVQKT